MNTIPKINRRLYYGDNLEVLRNKIADASVDLCYIDPPFNSKRNYFQIYNNQGNEDKAQAQAFVDTWEWGDESALAMEWINDIAHLNSGKLNEQTVELIKGLEKVLNHGGLFAYILSITLRIVEIHRVLKPTGSFYLHCDPNVSHYLKLVCDSVFCGKHSHGQFQNEIIWSYRTGGATKKRFARKHDVILFYSKSDVWNFNAQKERSYMMHKYGFKKSDFQIDESNGLQYSMVYTRDVFEIPSIGSDSAERLGYPTQKPEALLERIIQASSNPGDVVLDAYCGCGTTVAVAERLNRNWIGIDITYQSIGLVLKRLEDRYPDEWPEIEKNIKLDGIPRDLDSAIALANRKDDKTRKEFEKWAILTYCKNQARINEKKGADGGVDGVAYFLIDDKTNGKAIFQVKSGSSNRATLATLNSDRLREKAEFGFLISIDLPTKSMLKEIAAAGKYRHPQFNREDDRLQVITLAEIFQGKRLNLPMMRHDATKSDQTNYRDQLQDDLDFDSEPPENEQE
ncbi:MAG: DNA methyltransferase [Candidatus Symbiobacter sp.]|nr:DNA methyltransferase [Candidatus Symbiobacter sp.]